MVNYNHGKVYKYTCNITGDVSVGSTTKLYLSQRKANMLSNYKLYKKGTLSHTPVFDIIERGNYTMELLELVPCEGKDVLNQAEQRLKLLYDTVKPLAPVIHIENLTEYYKECSIMRKIGECF